MRKMEIYAIDPQAGMSPAEIRRALDGVSDDAEVRAIVRFNGRIKGLRILVEKDPDRL